ncbi:MAG: ribosome small subunit-dependent GTPase A [Spirochaetaceae bacterium]
MQTARVVSQDHHFYTVEFKDGRRSEARVSGAYSYRVVEASDYPVVGDYVRVDSEPDSDAGVLIHIHEILPRKAVLQRRRPGDRDAAQVIASHVDVALLVFGLDGGRAFTEGLLSRLVTTVRAGRVRPLIVLNKADLAENDRRAAIIRIAQTAVPHEAVCVVSARTGEGIPELRALWTAGETICLLGTSGVGKSSLLNRLAGAVLAREGEVRGDYKGRHTTTFRRLFRLPDGTAVIDVPGMRELHLWSGTDAVEYSFDDIRSLASGCRFRNCTHRHEPGCAVQQAIRDGALEPERFEQYLKLSSEASYIEQRVDRFAREERDRQHKPGSP